jgi:hypothetical protein
MGEGCVVIELQVLEEAGFDVLARPEALLAAVANSAEALWRSHQPRWPR